MIGFGYCCRLLRYAAFGLVVLAGSTFAADLFVSSTGTQTWVLGFLPVRR